MGDQSLSCGITKLRQEVPRTFKRFGASCYSGVPCFLPETGPTVRTRDIQFFRRVCVRKRSFAPGILFLVLALAVPALIFAQQNRSARRATTPDRSTTGASTTSKTAVTGPMIKNDFAEALSVIQSNHIDGPKLDYKAIFKSSISGMLSVLDPHSTYFDPDEYASFRTEQRSEYFGIGATLEDLREGSDVNTFIRATFPESPAYRAGLRFGDRITDVDGNSMKGKSYPEVRKFLLGAPDTNVQITFEAK